MPDTPTIEVDEVLLDLLNRVTNDDTSLTDAELAATVDGIRSIASEVNTQGVTDDDIALLTQARDVVGQVRQMQAERAEIVAQREAQAQAMLAEIAPPAVAPEPEVAAEVPEPVAAGGLPSISQLAHRRPASRRPIVASTESAWRGGREVLTAAGTPASEGIVETVRWALEREWTDRRSPHASDRERVRSVSVSPEWPEERTLNDYDIDGNEAKIEGVCGKAALLASGGSCQPGNVDYSVATFSKADRPVLDALPSFLASRGSIRYILPHSLASVQADGPTTIWSAANDISLSSPSTKGFATLVCGSPQMVEVTAVVEQVRLGNYQMRYSPETVEAYLAVADAAWARAADAQLLASIIAGSVNVTGANNLTGAASEFMADLARAASAMRYRNRMDPDAPLTLLYPAYLLDLFQADLSREMPVQGNSQLSVSDQEINTWFASKDIDAHAVWDSPTGTNPIQGFLPQGAGLLNPWPSKVQCQLFAPGTWVAISGGTLDLGVVRDSTLNRTNDLMLFKEVFENVAYRGVESLNITFDIVPSGARAGTVDTTALAVSGS